METLLYQRIKNIIYFFILGSIVISVFFILILNRPNISTDRIQSTISTRADKIENTINKNIQSLKKRADFIFECYNSNRLEHSLLLNRESLIIENSGVVGDYYGEIYYFKFKPIPVSKWVLIKKNKDIYFVQRCGENIYYFRFFFNLVQNDFLSQLKYPFLEAELKFFDTGVPSEDDQFQFDKIKGRFFFSRVIKSLNNQVVLHLKWLRSDIQIYTSQQKNNFLFLAVLLFFLVNILYFYYRPNKKLRFLLIFFIMTFFINCYILVSRLGRQDLYINLSLIKINSIYEIAVAVIFFWMGFLFFLNSSKKFFQNNILSFVFFNVFIVIGIKFCYKILSSLNFLYSDFNFSPDYLMLLLVLLIIHALPLYWIREISIKKNMTLVLGLLIFQIISGLIMVAVFKIGIVTVLAFSLSLLGILFLKKNLISRLVVLFLLTISIFHVIHHSALSEKEEFIDNNLKKIFSNQGNYAKFIAREIVHELNRYKDDFPDFFQGDWSSRLEAIWRSSIASRENIASGIFVISKDGELKSFYPYLVPFFKADEYKIFPLWAIEDTTTEVYGKKLSLAVASTSIFQKYNFLGRFIVQVLNSPELILRSQDKINIFTMNRKIKGSDLSYLTLNEKYQVLENPSNINLKNIAGIIKYDHQWIKFKFMDLDFSGYIFKQNKNSVIIFFPESTMVKKFSELIRIFLLYSLFFLIVRIKELKNIEWKKIYYSLSIRVFVILFLISLLTAIIFSIFSSDFFSQSSEIQMRHAIFDRGRTALNIGNNFIEESGELTLNQLFLLSAILNKDVSVYQRGELLFTSNYRKIIQSKIPVYLHSNILQLLNEKNQKFVLIKENTGFGLFFKTYDYIFNIEFPSSRSDFITEKSHYSNFIIVLFFCLLVIGISSAFFFSNKIMSPVRELNRGMEEVEKGNLMHLKETPSEIELKNLYLGFNAMVDGIKEQKKNISEISRMKTLLKMGRRVAHEVKNPLTPIKLSAEQILRSLKDKRKGYEKIIQKSVHFIIDESEHLKKVSYGFLDFSRLDKIEVEEFNLLDAVNEEVISFKSLYPKINFILQQQGIDFEVKLDKLKIKQVVKNILINSIEAIGEKQGEIKITIIDEQKRVFIKISDNGIGLDKKELEFIFDEDYSTKEIGTGLGLFIVKRIIELHYGSVEILSRKNQGTEVILDLPKDV